MQKQTSSREKVGRPRNKERLEWVGGLLTPPLFITDREEPYRPLLAMWLELPTGIIVGHEMVLPETTEGGLGRALSASMEKPMVGPPRRPDQVRVADAHLAPEIQEVLGGIPIVVAPTPELDEVLAAMLDDLPEDSEPGYLDDGRIPPEDLEKLFRAAMALFTVKPWETIGDDQVLRMDIPSLGVEGACVSVIGALEESRGVVIFPSLQGYEAFVEAAYPTGEGDPTDAGTDWIVLEFERGADLPDSMRREVAEQGWPVAGAEAYPVVRHVDEDLAVRPLSVRDIEIATACAEALATFFIRNPGVFQSERSQPVSESYFGGDDDREVRLTAPFEAFDAFEPIAAAPESSGSSRPKVSRNAPCPCGSGLKYKKCHLPQDEEKDNRNRGISPLHDLDERMVRALTGFAARHFRSAWPAFERDFRDMEATASLSIPWSVYGFLVEGRTVADAYLEARGKHCSAEDRAWLASQRAAWLSVWEVTGVDRGKTVSLRDWLSGETRTVTEVSGSEILEPGESILARVVDHRGTSILCGVHPRPLTPRDAAEVVRRARGRLRLKRDVPVERLRKEAFGRYLIRRWEEGVDDMEERSAILPTLQNTDGDPFLATTDHFEIAAGARADIETRLATMEDVEADDIGEDPAVFNFLRSGRPGSGLETVVIGSARLTGTTLQVETNSRERADDLRKRVEVACGDRLRHRGRVHADPMSSEGELSKRDVPEPEPSTPEMDLILRQYKERHYADWADHPLPALAGKSPREAARTAKGRVAVDTLLKEMEYLERRAGGAVFDFSRIRRELRL